MKNRKRTKQLHFMVDDAEREIINKKMSLLGTENIGAYLRRMAVYGYMVEVDMEPLNTLTTHLNRIGNNINQLVSSFMCDPALVDNQFLLSKKIYEQKTGRKQKNDIIAYQVRQAFRPGEVTPEMANKVGYELAEKITKGNNAFIVATHIDRRHVHNHIIWNSTTLDCKRKFRNFWNSASAVHKISDLLCLKNGLSIVENPKEKSKDYDSWLGEKRPLTLSDKIRQSIDLTLAEKPQDFNIFLDKMRVQGYEIKMGKHIAFKSPLQKKFIRLRSLGEGYSEKKIRDIIEGKDTHKPVKKEPKKAPEKVNMLIDILAKLTAGKGSGYERWAKTFNIKQMAKPSTISLKTIY